MDYSSKTNKPSFSILFLLINFMLYIAFASSCYVCNNPNPNPKPTPTPPSPPAAVKGTCPRDALKLGICAKLLNGSIGAKIGNPPDHPCCSALGGLLDLEAAICLCTALKANILGININIPISLSLLINTCGKTLPKDFICA